MPAAKQPKTSTKAKAKAAAKKTAAVKKANAADKTTKSGAPTKKAAPSTKSKAAAKKAPAGKAASKQSSAISKTSSAPRSKGNGSYQPYEIASGEEYMNEPQRQHFTSILTNWKLQLMQEVDRTVSHMRDEATNYPDPSDRASQEEEFSLELKTRDRERRLIKKIDSTLEMISQDDYGYCESCGVEIGIRRLEARPTATQCIDCKTLDEIKEKQILG